MRRNRESLPNRLLTSLDKFCGAGPGRVGEVMFLVYYSYRDVTDEIHTGS